jgi:hypothetical protein
MTFRGGHPANYLIHDYRNREILAKHVGKWRSFSKSAIARHCSQGGR